MWLFQRRTLIALLAVLAVHMWSCASLAQQPGDAAARGVLLAPSGFERVGTGPSNAFWIRDGLSGIVDTLVNSIAFIDNAGRVVGRAGLPDGFIVGGTQAEENRILLLSGNRDSAIELSRTIDPASVGTLTAQPLSAPRLASGETVRRNAWQLAVPSAPRAGRAGAGQLEVRSLTGDPLADATEIGIDSTGRRYVLWSEFVSASPDVVVRAFVGRYALDGRLVGIAEVPLADMDYVPDEYVIITGGGELRVMVPTRSSVEIRTIPIRAVPAVNPRTTKDIAGPNILRQLQTEKGRALKVETVISSSPDKSERRIDNPSPKETRAAAPLQPIARAKVIELAREFIAQQWTLSEKNYEHPGTSNVCNKTQRQYWSRPTWIRKELIGQTLTRLPYKWGGFDSPGVYLQRMGQGHLAGDVCTCRDSSHNDCTVAHAAGVDCSGFVSRTWGLPTKEGTSSLPGVSTTISGWERNLNLVKSGDALNRSGNHVRLVVEAVSTPQIKIVVIESTNARACTRRDGTKTICEGVCECARSITDFGGYRLLRFKRIQD